MVPIRRYASNWRTYVACGGLVLALLITCEAQRGAYAQNPGQAQTNSPESGSPASLGRSTLDYKRTCSKTQSETDANLCIGRESLKAYKKQAYWAEATFFIGAFGTGAILATLVYTARAVRASERSAEAAINSVEVAKHATASINRAYITFVGVEGSGILDSSTEMVMGVELQIFVRNAGQTPTRRVKGSAKTRFIEIPPGPGFDYTIAEGEQFWPEIASGENRGFSGVQIPSKDWDRLRGVSGAFLYAWGWVEYSDVFTGSDRHRTEFCVRISARGDLSAGRFRVGCQPYGPHNGTDEDCLRKPQTPLVAGAT